MDDQKTEELLNKIESLVKKLLERCEIPRQEWFSLKQAATYSGLSVDYLRRAVYSGSLPASRHGSPDRLVFRISRKDMETWMDERKHEPKPVPRHKKKEPEPLIESKYFRRKNKQ